MKNLNECGMKRYFPGWTEQNKENLMIPRVSAGIRNHHFLNTNLRQPFHSIVNLKLESIEGIGRGLFYAIIGFEAVTILQA